ncbi:pentapeptide repeat-containing protein [Nodosilinea sp. LEGE 06152]|uniref:AAA family ATPase n=1 Tax=Nodosilinea sp. LEGE 06152 TaxID=2777966 RepID=UPI00187FBD31|nr:AAA family ATPase [Nodosilinea sp. LEGE 06152]MBE9157110.1 pentapeptide repeat-containing protein [Nodosilinea sp. LEGE 06152]
MDFEEIAVLINQVAVERKGRPLKDVERLVLKGSWENKTYSAMATPTVGYTEDYLKKDVGPKLWQFLTELVDTDRRGIRVTKRNIQNVLQTWAAQGRVESPNADEVPPSPATSAALAAAPVLIVRDSPRIDLSDFGGRDAELAQIKRWVLDERCRTVVLWGLPGVGKTTLAAAAIAAIGPQVEQYGYLALPPDVTDEAVLAAILHWLNPTAPNLSPLAAVDWVLDQLEQRQILLILDSMDQLFESQQLLGTYRADTMAIQRLFHQGAERHHQSCLVWVSREKPADFSQVQGPRVQECALGDLDAEGIRPLLHPPAAPIVAPEDWTALSDRYGGHPLVLRGIGAILRDMYQGQPKSLLQAPDLVVPLVVQRTFTQALERLLPEEWAILYGLALAQEPMARDDLIAILQPTPEDGVVQSVLGRGWVVGLPAEGGGLVLSLRPIVQTLVLERLYQDLMAELEAESLGWLQRLPLITMTAREVVQERQRAAMLVPLGDELRRRYPTNGALAAKGDRLLKALSGLANQPGYGASNLIHLCHYLGLGLSGANFSQLAICQGDLRQVSLQGANFSEAQFSDTAFATALGRDPVAAFSPASAPGHHRYLATGDHEGRLLLWDLRRSKLVWMFDEDQSQGVRSLAFSPLGDLLAVGTETGQIWLWPVGTTYQTDVLSHHQVAVGALAFSPDGSQLASGDDSGQLCLWEVASGVSQGQIDGHHGPIHSLAYSAEGDRLVSGGDDQRACLWQTRDRTLLQSFQARSTASLRTAGFLADPNDPACPPLPFAAGYDDHCLTIWNLETGLPCWILPAEVQALPALAVSPNGRYLVCSRQDFSVSVWDIPERRACYTLPSLGAPVWALAFSTDSRYFVTGSNYTIKLWSARRGQCWRSFLSQAHRVGCLALSAAPSNGHSNAGTDSGPDSSTILTGHDDSHLRLWQIHAGNPYASGPRTLAGHGGPVRTVALSADGRWLASSADDQTLRLWSTVSGESQWVWPIAAPATLLSFSTSGQWLASVNLAGNISIWDTATGSCTGDLDSTPDSPSALTFSTDEGWLIVGARDGTIGLWPTDRYTRAGDLGAGVEPRTLSGHQGQVHGLAVSLDGSMLASASHDGTVRWWSLASDAGSVANSIVGLTPMLGELQGQWQHPAEQWLQGVTTSPTGEILAITSAAAQVELWAVETNQRRLVFSGHSQDIWQVSVSPSRTHLVTASQDDEIRVWALDSGVCQQILRPDRPYEGVNIRGATGLSDTETRMLKSLGAIVSY